MIAPEIALAFFAAALLVALAPGPDNLMVLSLGISRGRPAGTGFAVGCALGCATHTLWATLGASAALLASPAAFTLLKTLGGGYLVWLGIAALRSRGTAFHAGTAGRSGGQFVRHLGRGFVANAVNPKVALFFLALLPQFVNAGPPPVALQMLQLGLIFSLTTVLVFGTLGWFAGTIGRWFTGHASTGLWLDRATGLLFVALGVRLVLF